MTVHRFLLATALVLAACSCSAAQDVTYLPPPFVDDALPPPPPSYYFSVDFAFVQPRLRGLGGDVQDGNLFSPRLDWTVSPRLEIGLTNREPWNPYLGYRGIYSDRGVSVVEPFSNTLLLFSRSTELHALDLGMRSSPFYLFSVLRTEWDLSARLTVLDFLDDYHFDFGDTTFLAARAREQFVGAGPRGGVRFDLPLGGSGFSLGAQADAGFQWGGYRGHFRLATFDGQDLNEENDHFSKGGLLWHAGAQLGVRYAWPVCDPRIIYTAGYQYEAWFSKDLGLLEGGDRGRFDYHGPYVRFEWRF